MARTRPRASGATLRAGAAIAALLGAVPGCASEEKRNRPSLEALPTLQQIAPADPIKPPKPARSPRRAVRVRHVRVPACTAALWSRIWTVLGTEPLDSARVERWRARGMRVGVLEQAAAAKLRKRLPARSRLSAETLLIGPDAHPLRIAPPLAGPVRLERPGASGPRVVRGGRFQFLVRAGAGRLVVTPHRHRRSPRIRPRAPDEAARAGERFNRLSLRVGLGNRAVLAIGARTAGAATRPATREAAPPTRSLGELLFGLRPSTREARIVLINPP